MEDKHHQRFVLQNRSFANVAKRDIARLAETGGFSEVEVGRINIIVSEMISNLQKHVKDGGELLVKLIGKTGIELICLDRGPGIRDPRRVLQDGNSTTGTAGEGLGAIKRLSHEFELYSQPGSGTVLLSRLFKSSAEKKNAPISRFHVAALMVPKSGQEVCGDNFSIVEQGNNLYLIALNGLGHGIYANEASQLAADTFKAHHLLQPADLLREVHAASRKTRGSVGCCVHISASKKEITYSGVGNIAGKIMSVEIGATLPVANRNVIAYNGILGHNIPNSLHNHTHEWDSSCILVLHSDGILTRWELSKHPTILRHDPSVIAAVIYRDFCRQTDDTLVLVARST